MRRDWVIDRAGQIRTGTADDRAIERGELVVLGLRDARWSIRCRLDGMAPPAMVSLFNTLLDAPQRPVALTWFDGVWRMTHSPTPQAAISFLCYAVDARPSLAADRPRLLSRPSATVAERWLRVAKRLLPHLATVELTSDGRKALDECFRGRWLVAAIGAGGAGIETMARGDGYPPLDPFFSRPAAGGPRLEQLGDSHYREWLDQIYREVARSGVPRFEEVDALIRWSQVGDTRTRYWRILVPLGPIAGSHRVLTASANDTGIDLRTDVPVAHQRCEGLVS
jgi:hypothetical protein